MIAKINKNLSVKVVEASGNYICNYGESIAVHTLIGSLIISLPNPKENNYISIFDTDGAAASNPITVDAGSYFIDGYSTYTIDVNYSSVNLISDGNYWKIISRSSQVAGPTGSTGATGPTGPTGPAPSGTGFVSVNSGSPATISGTDKLIGFDGYGSPSTIPLGYGLDLLSGSLALVGATGSAGGDLSGSYPNPTVSKIQGRTVSGVAPTPGQALAWTGSAWSPSTITGGGGGGGGFTYYLNYSLDGYSPTPDGYWKEISTTPSGADGYSSTASLSIAETYYNVAEFITTINNPATTIIPGGIWDLNLYADADGYSNESYFRFKVSTWDGYAKNIIATSNDVYVSDPAVINNYSASVYVPTTTVSLEDRFAIEIEAAKTSGSSSTSFTAYFEDGYVSHAHTTIEAPGGTGVVKVVNGVYQTPASLIVDSDVSLTAAIAGSKITSATGSDLGVIQLSEDLGGTATAPSVIAIQGNPISSGSPNTNDRLTWTGSIWEGQADYTFSSDIPVSLSGGKTLGRYQSGDTIPATGKTPAEVIQLLAVEPIDPTVNLSSATTIQFNQTSISNILDFDYVINSLGGTVSSASLDWRRGGAGGWTTLSSSTATPDSYTHSLTDSAFNTATFNYRYVVTDSLGASATDTLDLVPASYAAPSISLSVAAVSSTSPETNTKREKGNVNTNLSGTITRNSPYVDLSSYTLQYQVNSGSWNDIGSSVAISGAVASISLTNHNPVASKTANSIGYRVKVVDAYGTSYSSVTTVTFLNIIFYGPIASAPATSAEVRSLGSRIFTDGSNPFILNTGNVENDFTAAMPATIAITQVIDLDALNADITGNYALSTFNVDDSGSTPTSYNVYTMSQAIPYTSNHRHQISR
jgi:hypothetical protein